MRLRLGWAFVLFLGLWAASTVFLYSRFLFLPEHDPRSVLIGETNVLKNDSGSSNTSSVIVVNKTDALSHLDPDASKQTINASISTNVGCLCGIIAYFNPSGYVTRYQNYKLFRERSKQQGLWLLVVELVFDSDDFQLELILSYKVPYELAMNDADYLLQLRTSGENVMWQKERLLNIALDHVPKGCKNVVWPDAEILFMNDNWINETCSALEEYQVIQPFQGVLRLQKGDNWIDEKYDLNVQEKKADFKASRGIAYSTFLKGKGKRVLNSQSVHGFTGFAWAARYDVLQTIRFYDANIAGGGDALMAHAFFGHFKRNKSENKVYGVGYTPYYYRNHFTGMKHVENFYLKWALKAYSIVQGRIGYIKGVALHLWHGTKANRQYQERFKLLSAADFQPQNDIRLSTCNQFTPAVLNATPLIWEWSSFDKSKLILHESIKEMFHQRQEDG